MTVSEVRNISMEKLDKQSHFLNERAKINIEQHRKGDHAIRLLDADGNPVVGARVKIHQTSHDFKYGANIFMLDEFKEPEINAKYRDTFAKYFNLATVPFFWEGTEPEEGKLRYDADSPKNVYRRPPTDLCVNYCEEKGILPKLHCLFYDKIIPDWLPKNDSAAMWRLYEKRFAEIAERYAGRMYEIEATNELISAYFWTTCSILANEKDIGVKMWNMARKYFPNDKLLINDSAAVTTGREGYDDRYYLMIENFLGRGAPIDKIGVQGHIFSGTDGSDVGEALVKRYLNSLDPDLIIRGLDILSEFGKPLEITEVTIPTVDGSEEAEALQAEMVRALYTIWFSTPRMESVVYWNVADNTAVVEPGWDENRCRGGLFHYDMTPKKSALELKRMFEEEWHTDLELVTDEQGFVRFRGFFGDYVATVGKESFPFALHRAHPTRTTHRLALPV